MQTSICKTNNFQLRFDKVIAADELTQPELQTGEPQKVELQWNCGKFCKILRHKDEEGKEKRMGGRKYISSVSASPGWHDDVEQCDEQRQEDRSQQQ